jgi:hypothetical protein
MKDVAMRLRYRKKPDQAVTAVRLALSFAGFTYEKWGAVQRAQSGDWLVDNGGDIHTVAAQSFARTYREISPGRWLKTTPIWAERATAPGAATTNEGLTHFEAGDWVVSNNEDGSDAYAISADKFEGMYELDAALPTGSDAGR